MRTTIISLILAIVMTMAAMPQARHKPRVRLCPSFMFHPGYVVPPIYRHCWK